MNLTTISILTIVGFVTMLTFSIPQTEAIGKGVKVCEQVDDSNCLMVFRWFAEDTSTDPTNLVVINGVFTRLSLISESTNNVEGGFEGMLVGQPKLQAEKTVANNVGSTTISYTISSKLRAFNNISGQVTIDDVPYDIHLKTTGFDATQLSVDESITNTSGTHTSHMEKLSIPVTVTMCNSENDCYVGFGTIKRESVVSTGGSATVTFNIDVLRAEVIGEAGLFELRLNYLQRTIT